MKTTIARLAAIAALALLSFVPVKSNAQSFCVAADFQVNGVTTLYCEGANTFADLTQDYLFIDTNPGTITATFSTMNVTKTNKGVTYTQITGWGYWYPSNPGAVAVPALVTATFTQTPSGQGSVSINVSNYYSQASLYTSGTASVVSRTALTMTTN